MNITVYPIIEDEDMNTVPLVHVKPTRIKTLISNIFSYYGKVSNIQIYDDHVKFLFIPNENMTNDSMENFLADDIIEAGPDTWMEGDISINFSDLINDKYYIPDKYYEFKLVGYKFENLSKLLLLF